jgi:hypothetical protein
MLPTVLELQPSAQCSVSSMRYPNLDPATQVMLLISIAVLIGMTLTRVAILFRRQYSGIQHNYPISWTNNQSKLFEQVRMVIGIAVGMTWVVFGFAVPRMPQNWPFGLSEVILTIGLLLLSNAWLLLLIPSDWEHSVARKVRFKTIMSMLVGWWAILITGLLVAIVLVAQPSQPIISMGTYAHFYVSSSVPV